MSSPLRAKRAADLRTKRLAIAYAVRSAAMALERGEPYLALRTARQLVLTHPRKAPFLALLAKAEAVCNVARNVVAQSETTDPVHVGHALMALGDYDKASRIWLELARANPTDPTPFVSFAWCMARKGNVNAASAIVDQVAGVSHDLRLPAIGMMIALERGDPARAEAIARSAIAHTRKTLVHLPFGAAYETAGPADLVAAKIGPALEDAAALLHMGAVLEASAAGEHKAAIAAAEAILSAIPDDLWAAVYVVRSYIALKDHMGMIGAQARVIRIQKGHPTDLHKAFSFLFNAGTVEESIAIGRAALEQRPENYTLRFSVAYAAARMGEHAYARQLVTEDSNASSELLAATNPFVSMGFYDDPHIHRIAGISQAAAMGVEHDTCSVPVIGRNRPARIKIGLFSNDFHWHPVCMLLPDVLKRIDRTRFEVVCYSFDRAPNDHFRDRLRNAVDQFVDVTGLEGNDLIARIRGEAVHILFDLKGYTEGHHMKTLRRRLAPIQTNWLGYSGTVGIPEMDYIMGDPIVAPPGTEANFTEKVVRMPETFFPYHDGFPPAPVPTRAECGLPETGFVFASFNQIFKMNEAMFAAWADILNAVPGSILWLTGRGEKVEARQRAMAAEFGLDPSRLYFAPHKGWIEQHIARIGLVGLALDTYPYGSHTTAADTLFGGAPLLTLQGKSFNARVSSSIVSAHGLPQLIATTYEEYIAKAVEIGNDPDLAASLKALTIANKRTQPMFNSARFAAHFEIACEMMVERWLAHLPPAAIEVPTIEARRAAAAPLAASA